MAALELPDLVVLMAGEDVGGLTGAAPLIAVESLRDRVIVREGFQSMDEAAELFAATDTVTLAYRQASASGVLMLAYGFGRPVVIYPTGGLPEVVVDGETGWICERSDPDSLTDALRAAAAAGPGRFPATRGCRRPARSQRFLLGRDRPPNPGGVRRGGAAGSGVLQSRILKAATNAREISAARNRALLLRH